MRKQAKRSANLRCDQVSLVADPGPRAEAREFFSIEAKYHVAPDATRTALQQDADLLLLSAMNVVELTAIADHAPQEVRTGAMWSALYLLRMTQGITEAADKR